MVEWHKPSEGERRNKIIIFQAKHYASTIDTPKAHILERLFARGEDAEKAGLFEEALDGTITSRFVQHSVTGEQMKTVAAGRFSASYDCDEEDTNQEVVYSLSREAVEPSMSIGLALGGVKEDEELMLEGD